MDEELRKQEARIINLIKKRKLVEVLEVLDGAPIHDLEKAKDALHASLAEILADPSLGVMDKERYITHAKLLGLLDKKEDKETFYENFHQAIEGFIARHESLGEEGITKADQLAKLAEPYGIPLNRERLTRKVDENIREWKSKKKDRFLESAEHFKERHLI